MGREIEMWGMNRVRVRGDERIYGGGMERHFGGGGMRTVGVVDVCFVSPCNLLREK